MSHGASPLTCWDLGVSSSEQAASAQWSSRVTAIWPAVEEDRLVFQSLSHPRDHPRCPVPGRDAGKALGPSDMAAPLPAARARPGAPRAWALGCTVPAWMLPVGPSR